MQEQQFAALVEPVLIKVGLKLDNIEVIPVGRRRLLRTTVDGDGPYGCSPMLDDIPAASMRIPAAPGASNAVGNIPYTLEVTSRDVGKPLTEAEYYRHNHGRLIHLSLIEREYTGRVLRVISTRAKLNVDGTKREVPSERVCEVQVEVEPNPPKEPALPGEEAGNKEEA